MAFIMFRCVPSITTSLSVCQMLSLNQLNDQMCGRFCGRGGVILHSVNGVYTVIDFLKTPLLVVFTYILAPK